jgi:hypothetical protein
LLSDLKQLEELLDREYSVNDLHRQRERLLVLLGRGRSNFYALQNSHGLPAADRQELFRPISEWVAEDLPLFPTLIQGRILRLAKLAGVWRTDDGVERLNTAEVVDTAQGDWHLVIGYERLLRLKCRDPGGAISTKTAPFPTPPDATWEDVTIRFIDGHNIFVKVKRTTGTFEYTQMGMADGRNSKPTEQWKLLEVFAENEGVLTWKSSKADRKNQKRREELAKNLRAFFRIEGDPFRLIEGRKGWRARFRISPVPQDE